MGDINLTNAPTPENTTNNTTTPPNNPDNTPPTDSNNGNNTRDQNNNGENGDDATPDITINNPNKTPTPETTAERSNNDVSQSGMEKGNGNGRENSNNRSADREEFTPGSPDDTGPEAPAGNHRTYSTPVPVPVERTGPPVTGPTEPAGSSQATVHDAPAPPAAESDPSDGSSLYDEAPRSRPETPDANRSWQPPPEFVLDPKQEAGFDSDSFVRALLNPGRDPLDLFADLPGFTNEPLIVNVLHDITVTGGGLQAPLGGQETPAPLVQAPPSTPQATTSQTSNGQGSDATGRAERTGGGSEGTPRTRPVGERGLPSGSASVPAPPLVPTETGSDQLSETVPSASETAVGPAPRDVPEQEAPSTDPAHRSDAAPEPTPDAGSDLRPAGERDRTGPPSVPATESSAPLAPDIDLPNRLVPSHGTLDDTDDLAISPLPHPTDTVDTRTTDGGVRRLDYMITSEWIESYGVRTDIDGIFETVGDTLPTQVEADFRKQLERDSRPFFQPEGVTVAGPDGRGFTLRLASVDNRWTAGTIPGDRSLSATAQYKGLHEAQEQNGRSESGMHGSAKRVGASFSGHLLATGGVAPLPGFRINGGVGSSSWQQSGGDGRTATRTTEMVGAGADYRAALDIRLETTGPSGGNETSAQLPSGVQLTIMGGLRPPSSPPRTISFADAFDASPRNRVVPRQYGRYLGNSHPIWMRYTSAPTAGTDSSGGTAAPRDPGQWLADRLGYDTVAPPPGPGSSLRSRIAWQWKKSAAYERGQQLRSGFTPKKMANYLPTMTTDPVTLLVHDAEGNPRAVTFWSQPVSMRTIPDVPDKFTIKHTDRSAKDTSISAARTDGLTVRPGFGFLERVAADLVRLEIPYYEYSYTREKTESRSRGTSAWNSPLFHSSDTTVYEVDRRIAVWVDGESEPTFFDAASIEALTSQEARVLAAPASNRPDPTSPDVVLDPFLDRNRIVNFGDALVRNVTYPDGGEVRQREGRPVTVFREYAHELLTRINKQYPGMVLPHMAIPGAAQPRNTHTGWNHRRNHDAAVRNTVRVLEAASLNGFRFQRDEWVSHGVEVKLEETKKYPGWSDVRRPSLRSPDHVSLWLTARVARPRAGADLADSNTGSGTGAAAKQQNRVSKIRTHAHELRAAAMWRQVMHTDARGYPDHTAGAGARLGWESRRSRNHTFGRSVTGEHNVKDKGASQQLFSNVVFGARIGAGSDLVPWPSRVRPRGSDTSTDLFTDSGVAGRVELHTVRNRRPIPMDPPLPSGPLRPLAQRDAESPAAGSRQEVSRLAGAPAKDLFHKGIRSRIVGLEDVRAREAQIQETPAQETRTRRTRAEDTRTQEARAEEAQESDAGLEIVQTPGARRLMETFSSPQALNPVIAMTPEGFPISVLSHTYAELDQDHYAFANSMGNGRGTALAIANYLAPQTLAAVPEISGNLGSRLRVQYDDGVLPTRTRTTLSTWYVPTRIVSFTLRPKATVESSQTVETSLGYGTSKSSSYYFALFAGYGGNPNPTDSGPTASPDDATRPVIRPRGEVRLDVHGRGARGSESLTFRIKTEVKLQGPAFAYVTDGVIGQAVERKHDFNFLLTVPRSPSTHGYSAWLASVESSRKGLVPALWAYTDGLVPDLIAWNPDGTVGRVGTQPPPAAPAATITAFDGFADKGYQSKPIDPQEAIEDLVADLKRANLELTDWSREDLFQQLSSNLNRGLGDLPPLPVRIRPVDFVHTRRGGREEQGGTATVSVPENSRSLHAKGWSSPAHITVEVVRGASRTSQMGGRMEFVEKVSVTDGASRGTFTFNGLSGGASVELRFPPSYPGSDEPGPQPQQRPVGMGPEFGYQGRRLTGDSWSAGESRELSHERVLFSPYAVVDTDTVLVLTLHTGDGAYQGMSGAGQVQNIYPTPYLTMGGDAAGAAPSAPRVFRDSIGLRAPNRETAVQRWADERARQGSYVQTSEDTRLTPVGVNGGGTAVFDAAFAAAAMANGWRPPATDRHPDHGLSPASVDAAKGFLNGKGDGFLISPLNFVTGELVLQGLTAAALGAPGGTELVRFGETTVSLKALVDPTSVTLLSASEESRSRDAEQGASSGSSDRQEAGGHGGASGWRGVVSSRDQDRMHENTGGTTMLNIADDGGVSSGVKDTSVAQGPGSRRLFLVSVPTTWLATAEAPGAVSAFGPTHHLASVEADAPLTLWIGEDEARSLGLDVDAPELVALAGAEAVFGKADLDYLQARGALNELVGGRDARADDPSYRAEYVEAERLLGEADAERTRLLRELEEALERARTATRTRVVPAAGDETGPGPARPAPSGSGRSTPVEVPRPEERPRPERSPLPPPPASGPRTGEPSVAPVPSPENTGLPAARPAPALAPIVEEEGSAGITEVRGPADPRDESEIRQEELNSMFSALLNSGR
ncbi:hypothetical protein [Nocardiopsis ansamitocini]|uniref:hypothetical protein n=1 Tax=Nocardiopsis ansamitocini TaxID=1670832 RepID=UPI0025564F23|nr:hypothetical protein [Nocardiopsis ansamitocini]